MAFFCDRTARHRAAEGRHNKHNDAEQQIHGALRYHQLPQAFALGVNLDVSRLPRHVADGCDEFLAPWIVEPDLLETIKDVAHAGEEAALPVCRRARAVDAVLV